MKDALNAAFGHALEQISAEPEIASRIKGRVGHALASVATVGALAVAGLLAPTAAFAQNYPGQSGGFNAGCVIGGIAGGLLGNTVGGGNGRTVAAAAGAVAGCVTGSGVQRNNEIRQAPQQQPMQNAYQQPSRYQGPVTNAHPMASYAPACMAQWNGEGQPSRPLSREASVALTKGEQSLGESYSRAADAQELYAKAYSNFQRVKGGEYSPYNNMSASDSMAIRDASSRAHSDMNSVSRMRQDAERSYAANTLRVLDACEYAASQGEDVRSFARLQGLMTMKTVEQWSVRQPKTGMNIRVVTGGEPARIERGYSEQDSQPRLYRP